MPILINPFVSETSSYISDDSRFESMSLFARGTFDFKDVLCACFTTLFRLVFVSLNDLVGLGGRLKFETVRNKLDCVGSTYLFRDTRKSISKLCETNTNLYCLTELFNLFCDPNLKNKIKLNDVATSRNLSFKSMFLYAK